MTTLPNRAYPHLGPSLAYPLMFTAMLMSGAASAQDAPPPTPPSFAAKVTKVAEIELAEPQGPVILTIDGEIGARNGENGVELDLDMLKAMGVQVIETSTIWTRTSNRFEGVPLATVLQAVQPRGTRLRLQALNDYAYEISIADLLAGDPILAFSLDGVALSARDKGPLWLIYPFDESPSYQTEQHFVRAIWQLNALQVLP